ncbi:CdaR family transcriptional regulator [Streptomyces sp. Amel2xC10]|uniref:PucR family transcriptional regulator n=1 Tax=Streptomyces sp. Amel2xC10 TaxID=1305826 RepID=UPI000A08B7D7|nr:helix-turn-helix domain-containing protein [Streptomyces sp. Amel2xC10]SME91874.1 PucR C-terminal helix-turn-helix domain-containing protein [Streptomyces sp. Amel2xC10]
MTVVHGPEQVTAVLRDMARDPDVCGELVRVARSRSPELSRLTEEATRSHVTAMIRAAGPWFAALERSGSVEEQDFTAALLLGADRAVQGVPMTAVLQGVQAALARAAELAVDRCRSAGVADGVLLSVVLRLQEYGNAVERHVINGYRAAEHDSPRALDAVRTRLLRQALLGEVPPRAEELARAGVRADAAGHHRCLAALPGGRPALRSPHAVTALIDGRLAGLCPRPPSADEIDAGALVVIAPAAPLPELPALYRLCARAAALGAERGLRGLYDVTDLAGRIALSEQPLLASLVSRRLLGALDPGNDFHRQLARTALTFLDNGRRLDQTAAALFTHPNTVRYRLGRLRQITSASLTDGDTGPLDTLHWWWALTTWLHADGTPPPV